MSASVVVTPGFLEWGPPVPAGAEEEGKPDPRPQQGLGEMGSQTMDGDSWLFPALCSVRPQNNPVPAPGWGRSG